MTGLLESLGKIRGVPGGGPAIVGDERKKCCGPGEVGIWSLGASELPTVMDPLLCSADSLPPLDLPYLGLPDPLGHDFPEGGANAVALVILGAAGLHFGGVNRAGTSRCSGSSPCGADGLLPLGLVAPHGCDVLGGGANNGTGLKE